jgi:hypothetical protein
MSAKTETINSTGELSQGAGNSKEGNCKLCEQFGRLQRSHFLCAGIYRRLVPDKSAIRHPVLVTPQTAMLTSVQMKDYVFCAECERRFDQGGEDYVLRQMRDNADFPLLERLNVSPPVDFSTKEGTYAGKALGIDMKKFGYFALSMVWRSTVHKWLSIRGHKPDSVELGTLREPIRLFLLDRAPFPQDVTVLVTACTDTYSQHAVYAPTKVLGSPTPGISFLACGIHFLIWMGTPNPVAISEFCCYRSERGYVFTSDASSRTIRAYAALHSTARMRGLLARSGAAS